MIQEQQHAHMYKHCQAGGQGMCDDTKKMHNTGKSEYIILNTINIFILSLLTWTQSENSWN